MTDTRDINQDEIRVNDEQIDRRSEGGLDTQKKDEYSDDEVQFEDIENDENPVAVLKKMRERLKKCEAEKKEYLDGWQRMRADFANARKEEEVRRGELVKFASEGLLEDLLPILDSFSMAFSNKESWEKVDANWRKGVEYIYTQFLSVLESRGLEEVGVTGEHLDPRIHVAIEIIPTDDTHKEDTVSEVIQKGYRLHSKVVRPARIKAWSSSKHDA